MEKQINGFSNYTVSNDGRVFSYKSGNKVELKQKQKDGYMNIGITSDDGVRKFKRVHRLVAEMFIPNPENKSDVNHINGIKNDNCVANLEWATTSENRIHAFETGLQKPHSCNMNGNSQGSKLPQSKLTEVLVSEMRKYHRTERKRGERTWEKYGISETNYWYVVSEGESRSWKHVE